VYNLVHATVNLDSAKVSKVLQITDIFARLHLQLCSGCNRLLCVVVVFSSAEQPDSHNYAVVEGRNTVSGSFARTDFSSSYSTKIH